jgi:hypothetical protein
MERSAMEENNMTDDDRKVLTEFLGQCAFLKADNRTFTTPDDMMAVKDKLEERGLLKRFWAWNWDKYCNPDDFENVLMSGESCLELLTKAQDPARFCQLAVEFLKEE